VTVGNALRRTLLSSLEGAAPVCLRLEGAGHEFTSIPGMVEDVIDIALNVKGILVRFEGEGPETLKVDKAGPGPVTAGDFRGAPGVEIVNPGWTVATLEKPPGKDAKEARFTAEVEFRKGRGYVRAEDFAWKTGDQVGVIPLDAGFSPVVRARWQVEETRVGQFTDYDRLILEVWTNGVVRPEMALVEAAAILRKHLNQFVKFSELGEEFAAETPKAAPAPAAGADPALRDMLAQPVSVLDPSVRATNCLSAEGIKTLEDLVARTEPEMLEVRNFGKNSLKEIKQRLAERGLAFGMFRPKDEEPRP
jgi:DNA-directed RNA polymerase subunit alpha